MNASSSRGPLLDHALRSLDPADDPATLDSAHRARASATLEQILAGDPAPATRRGQQGCSPHTTRRRVARAAAGVAAALAAVVLVPVLGDEQSAYATWSPVPEPLTGSAAEQAVDACRERSGQDSGDGVRRELAAAVPRLTEQRGGWSFVLLDGAGGFEATCLLGNDDLDDAAAGEEVRFFGSLDAEEEEPTSPAPGDLVTRTLGTGTIDDDAFNFASGVVGEDVAEVRIETPTGRDIEASVGNGAWAAWWPAGKAEADNPEIAEDFEIQVVLVDGTVLPPRPSLETMEKG